MLGHDDDSDDSIGGEFGRSDMRFGAKKDPLAKSSRNPVDDRRSPYDKLRQSPSDKLRQSPYDKSRQSPYDKLRQSPYDERDHSPSPADWERHKIGRGPLGADDYGGGSKHDKRTEMLDRDAHGKRLGADKHKDTKKTDNVNPFDKSRSSPDRANPYDRSGKSRRDGFDDKHRASPYDSLDRNPFDKHDSGKHTKENLFDSRHDDDAYDTFNATGRKSPFERSKYDKRDDVKHGRKSPFSHDDKSRRHDDRDRDRYDR